MARFTCWRRENAYARDKTISTVAMIRKTGLSVLRGGTNIKVSTFRAASAPGPMEQKRLASTVITENSRAGNGQKSYRLQCLANPAARYV